MDFAQVRTHEIKLNQMLLVIEVWGNRWELPVRDFAHAYSIVNVLLPKFEKLKFYFKNERLE